LRRSIERTALTLSFLAAAGFVGLACSSNSDSSASTTDGGGTNSAGGNTSTGGASSGSGGAGLATGNGGGAPSGGSGTGGAARASGGSSGTASGGADGDGGVSVPPGDGGGGDTVTGDTYLPWAGGPAYFAKWTHGPPSDPKFFPIAVWLQTPSNATRYKAAGINLFVGLYNGPTDQQLSTLKTAGVPTFCDQSGVWNTHLTDTTLWGWLQPDEPDNAQSNGSGGYDPCIDPSVIVAGYQKMVKNDASRPVWLGLGRGVSDTQWGGRGTCTGKTAMYTDYAKGADILSFDIYPVNGGIGLEAVPNGVDNLRQWSGNTKPVVADIEGSNIDNTTRPTAAQIKSEVWMALVHGAAGIQYFCHRFTPSFSETDCIDDTARATALGKINAEVTSFAEVLNTRSVGNGVTVSSSATDKPVDTLLKRFGGATYLFATEMRSGTTTATFTLRDFPASGASAEVVGENRTIPIASGVFKDDFASYGVHLYKITRP
jgi:hypothetical protein